MAAGVRVATMGLDSEFKRSVENAIGEFDRSLVTRAEAIKERFVIQTNRWFLVDLYPTSVGHQIISGGGFQTR